MEFFYGGNGSEEMAVDGDGDLRRGRRGDGGDDSETKATAARGVGAKRLKEESTRAALGIYTPSLSVGPSCKTRWHRDG